MPCPLVWLRWALLACRPRGCALSAITGLLTDRADAAVYVARNGSEVDFGFHARLIGRASQRLRANLHFGRIWNSELSGRQPRLQVVFDDLYGAWGCRMSLSPRDLLPPSAGVARNLVARSSLACPRPVRPWRPSSQSEGLTLLNDSASAPQCYGSTTSVTTSSGSSAATIERIAASCSIQSRSPVFSASCPQERHQFDSQALQGSTPPASAVFLRACPHVALRISSARRPSSSRAGSIERSEGESSMEPPEIKE